MTKIVIVEDNDTIKNGLQILIDGTAGYTCVGAFPECDTMIRQIKNINPDVLLMDLGLPYNQCIEGIKQAKVIFSNLAILVLTIYEENELIFDALCAGACGYIAKNASALKIIESINDAIRGGSPMNSTIAMRVIKLFNNKKYGSGDSGILLNLEKEILNKLISGNNLKAIGDSLNLSIEEVRIYLRNIYKKAHLLSQIEAVEN